MALTNAPEPRPIRTITNRRPGPCRHCGVEVPAGTGEAVLLAERGAWMTQHTSCPIADQPVPSVGVSETVPPVQPRATVITYAPTAEQAAIIEAFAAGENLVIQAGAGAGKTSTLLFLANQALAAGRTGQYTAFNSAIVKDVAAKLPGNVRASTMHSLAFAAVGRAYAHRLNGRRQRQDEIARLLGISSYSIPFGGQTKTLPAGWLAGKVMAAVRRYCASEDREIGRRHIARMDGVDMPTDLGEDTWDNNDAIADHLLPYVRAAWADLTATDGRLRFSHDIYLKMWALGSPDIDADFIALDEAQDADPVMVGILEHNRKAGKQIVVVGDECQIIYEWRGAVDALARFEQTGATVLYLTQSFRFGTAIADVANGLLGRLNARLRITGTGTASRVEPAISPDAILTRTNATAVRQLIASLEEGRRAHLVGGGADVKSFVEAAAALMAGRATSHPELACFSDWRSVQAYVADEEDGAELRLMVKLVDDFGTAAISGALDRMGEERDADLVISTAHKSKGREWDTVQIAGDFKAPKEGEELAAAELRLAYVAATRARKTLDITAVPHFAR